MPCTWLIHPDCSLRNGTPWRHWGWRCALCRGGRVSILSGLSLFACQRSWLELLERPMQTLQDASYLTIPRHTYTTLSRSFPIPPPCLWQIRHCLTGASCRVFEPSGQGPAPCFCLPLVFFVKSFIRFLLACVKCFLLLSQTFFLLPPFASVFLSLTLLCHKVLACVKHFFGLSQIFFFSPSLARLFLSLPPFYYSFPACVKCFFGIAKKFFGKLSRLVFVLFGKGSRGVAGLWELS